MITFQRALLGSTLFAATFPLLASDLAPDDIIIRNHPQHFITYDGSADKVGSSLQSFEYTVQVNTTLDIDNVYYLIAQDFKDPKEGYDPKTGIFHYSYGNSGSFYSGIQPHSDGTVGFRFSSFTAGSKPKNDLCHNGADLGAGVTCALDNVAYTPGGKYTIKIEKTAADSSSATYKGSVTDRTTGIVYTIGEWSVPLPQTGELDTSFIGTIEKYGISNGTSCSIIPLVNVEYSDLLYNGKPAETKVSLKKYPPTLDGSSNHTCTGIPRSTSATATPTASGYVIKNSDG